LNLFVPQPLNPIRGKLVKKKESSTIDLQKIYTFGYDGTCFIFEKITWNAGASPSGKAAVFGTAMRRFESFRPKPLELRKEMTDKSFMLFAGSSHKDLAKKVAERLRIQLGQISIETFPDGEIGVQILENVRGKDVFVLQSPARHPNRYLMELLIIADALKRASVRSVVAVIPYYAYARQDRKDKGRVPITAKLVADLLEKAGVSRVLTMDLHTEQIQGFFNVPVDNLYARPLFVRTLKGLGLKDLVVVSPDVGSNKMARQFAEDLKVDLAIVDKRRINSQVVQANALIGEVKGKNVLLVDDICSTGGTLKIAAQVCRAEGAKSVHAVISHALLMGDFLENSGIDKMYVSDSVPLPPFMGETKVQAVSVADLFGQAIERIVSAESISSLFKS
jgi:ribose-phosphate pyrophosphokinase